MLISCFTIAWFLLLWFNTEAFVEYLRIICGDWNKELLDTFKISNYLEIKKLGSDSTYPDFLLEYHPCFLTKLLSCPTCTSGMLSLFASLLCGIYLWPSIAIISLVIYTITKWLITNT